MTQQQQALESASQQGDVVEKLKDWIVAQNKSAQGMGLDTDIIENRLIDSLNFINFLLLVEELRGRDIPEEQVVLDRFRTLRAIRENFLA